MGSNEPEGTTGVHFHCPENDDFYGAGIYQELDPSHQHIRLLQARRPDESDPDGLLRFTMAQRLPLSECQSGEGAKHPFIAMSYCAGSPYETVPVLIDGKSFNVFRSLHLALHSLLHHLGRKKNEWELESTLWIWADQVCINQSNDVEKTQQVLMMREIYESCAWAYSWLGLSPGVSEGLRNVLKIDHIQQIIEKHFEDEGEPVNNVRNIENLGSWTVVSVDKLHEMGVDWATVNQFFQCPYWYRGWICQEVTVAPDITFNTNSAETDRAGVRRALRLLETIRLCLRWNFDVFHGELVQKQVPASYMDVEGLRTLVPLVGGLSWLYEMDLAPFLFMLEQSEDWKEIDGYTIDQLMLTARHSEVTDPLDKIYAYLGLATPGYDITPDYSMTNTEVKVHIEATAAYIKLHKGLDILSFAEERNGDTGPSLPSWVCDWTVKKPTGSLWYCVRGDENVAPTASNSAGCEANFFSLNNEPNRVLGVSAIVVDKISNTEHQVGKPISSYGSWEECLGSWLGIAGLSPDRGSCPENEARYPHHEDYTLATAFWSTLLRGLMDAKTMEEHWKEGEPEPGSESHKIEGTGIEISGHHLKMGSGLDKGYLTRAGWRFFCSDTGYHGITKAVPEDGDVVCVLIGADMPFLLRPYLDGYQLMGEVYLQGIMKGEVMRTIEGEEGGEGKFVEEDIKVY
ncbi:heterokaryon incompatibility protein-domain-containing protein [Podospora aff. communis PSN243]|uniref:Heterokaryon incompatibility protein-domain-containing protein n=1 Tax=Podospora aff. communis PSN243 TaxID=3040156 RepID=A0AAV9G523_9PEZI|nr:heterokaryon incompatibility protein-domain-containing protein [Podospora aff. communis PSN243]